MYNFLRRLILVALAGSLIISRAAAIATIGIKGAKFFNEDSGDQLYVYPPKNMPSKVTNRYEALSKASITRKRLPMPTAISIRLPMALPAIEISRTFKVWA